MRYEIGQLEDLEAIHDLVKASFDAYIKKDYSDLGVEEFYKYIHMDHLKARYLDYQLFVAKNKEKIVGVLQGKDNHINMLFVDKDYHKQGISKSLLKCFNYLAEKSHYSEITVNASPYAVEIYQHLGFEVTEKEINKQGFRYTPMTKYIEEVL